MPKPLVVVALIVLLCTSALAQAIDISRMAQVDQLIDQAIQRGEIPGAVLLVGQQGKTLYHKAYGQRALQPQPQPMTPDTIFDLASLSKPVGCATAIMLLADRGKLKLHDRVAQYIPAFAANGKEHITIEQLLLHQSGLIPDNLMADYSSGPETALAKIHALRPLRTPGSSFWYSDVGYIVLGELVRIIDGRPLDQFAEEEIFRPLGMNDTAYTPPDSWKPRCAPTQQRQQRWMIGQVHDPRAYALGGVAGHAGVFSTAADLARYCRMILALGQLDGQRLLSESAVRQMTQPRCLPDGTEWRTCGFDVDTGYSSCRGERFEPRTTFGHTGFTGTMFWLDPKNDCFFILLTNAVHPDGKGKTIALRKAVATLVAEALLGPAPARTGPSLRLALGKPQDASGAPAEVLCGIDVLQKEDFKPLLGRRVALITNHTGRDRQGRRLVDLLLAAKGVNLVRVFSPEHGLYGQLDEKVGNTVDPATGLKVYSLYGPTTRPSAEMMEGIDTLVFDIQDVGARFYTYISTLGYCMEAAAQHNARMVVLDRPNPITGLIVDGPLADSSALGFTAFAPIPVAHGMTIGELARFYNEERAIHCDLSVIEIQGWKRSMWFDQTGLKWVNPSPNMRNLTQALLYPGICLLETTNVSVGRGTDQPFEVFGAPWIDAQKLAAALNAAKLPGLRFIPIEFTPASSKFANQPCQGVYLLVTDRQLLQPVRAGLTIAWHLRHLFGDAFQFDQVNRLLKNKAILNALKTSSTPSTLPSRWSEPLDAFKNTREKYLLYR